MINIHSVYTWQPINRDIGQLMDASLNTLSNSVGSIPSLEKIEQAIMLTYDQHLACRYISIEDCMTKQVIVRIGEKMYYVTKLS